MARYKKRPVEVEAIQFIDDNPETLVKISEFMGEKDLRVSYEDPKNPKIIISTLEGDMQASVGDFIIRGAKGEYYPCKPDIFEMTYEEVDGNEIQDLSISTFTFGEAISKLKKGQKVARKGWNGKGMFVVYQKAYPKGIPCNKQTAKAWGMSEGDLFVCNPYLQIKCVDGSHSMWVPSINDILAEDWVVV